MSTKNKPAAPAAPAPAPAPAPGANIKAVLMQTTAMAIQDARGSRVFAAHLLEMCRGAKEEVRAAHRRAAMVGYVAEYLAKPGVAEDTHIAAAAVMLDKPVKDRSDADVKALGAARVRWFNVVELTRETDPTVFPKSESKSAAKKAQRARGEITTKRGTTKAAKGSKATKGVLAAPDTIKAATRSEAVATIAQMSGAVMAFAEASKRLLGAKNMTQVKKAHALLMSLTTEG
jgi:hypothetical protein